MSDLDLRLEAAAEAAWRQNIQDQMLRGKFPPKVEWAEADDATKAAWRSVTAAAVEAWNQAQPQ